MLQVVTNPLLLFSTDYSRFADPSTNVLGVLSEAQAERLRQVASSLNATFQKTDLDLLSRSLLQFKHDSEATDADTHSRIRMHRNGSATIVVMPTEKCNLRCTYCYETFKLGKMKPQVQSALQQFLQTTLSRTKKVHLCWFGGEPLLAPEIVEQVTSDFRAKASVSGSEISVSMTTNGTIHDALERLCALNIIDVFQITIDGPKDIHDKQRIDRRGRGSYAEVMSGVLSILQSSSSRVQLRVNIDTKKEIAVSSFGKWLSTEIKPLLEKYAGRISLSIVPIWDATTTQISGICLRTIEEASSYFRAKSTVLAAQGRSQFEELLEILGSPGALACYAGHPSSFVVGANGDLYKCSVAFDLPQNRIGQLASDGTPEIDEAKHKLWISMNAISDTRCGGCAFNTSCQGVFCPLLRLQTGRPPCPTEKVFRDLLLDSKEPIVHSSVGVAQS